MKDLESQNRKDSQVEQQEQEEAKSSIMDQIHSDILKNQKEKTKQMQIKESKQKLDAVL